SPIKETLHTPTHNPVCTDCVTAPKQTWLEENQTRAVEFSRNNHTTRTSPENPQKDSRSLFRRRCVCVSALLCLHISSSPEHSPNRRLFENGLRPRDEEPATTRDTDGLLRPQPTRQLFEPTRPKKHSGHVDRRRCL